MATLSGSDLLVVQNPASKINYSLTVTNLQAWLNTNTSVIVYKGTGDMNDAAETPSPVAAGYLYINSNSAGGQTFKWTGGAAPDGNLTTPVSEGTRAIYNGATWDLNTPASGDIGVETIQPAVPITVDSSDASSPIIGVTGALFPDADSGNGITPTVTADFGVVAIADAAALTAGSETLVVTAKQLKDTNDALEAATAGGVSNIIAGQSITVLTDGTNGSSTTSPQVSAKKATTGTADANYGVVPMCDNAAKGTDASQVTTEAYIDAFYLVKDWSGLDELTAS